MPWCYPSTLSALSVLNVSWDRQLNLIRVRVTVRITVRVTVRVRVTVTVAVRVRVRVRVSGSAVLITGQCLNRNRPS